MSGLVRNTEMLIYRANFRCSLISPVIEEDGLYIGVDTFLTPFFFFFFFGLNKQNKVFYCGDRKPVCLRVTGEQNDLH